MGSKEVEHRSRGVDVYCDIMKLLRTQALSRPQIAGVLEYHLQSVSNRVKELEDNGFLRSFLTPPANGKKAVVLYTVTKVWGGKLSENTVTE